MENFSGFRIGSPFLQRILHSDIILLILNLFAQILLGFFFGHAYDMRIFMATGYLVGTGQNPYIARDLSTIFNNASFSGITSVGYPPPWALLLGLIYWVSYRLIPNFLLYNLAIKIPIIAANICLAYLVTDILRKIAVSKRVSRKAWLFLLFNPLLLLVTSAWGQFDSIVALLSLLALLLLSEDRLLSSAVLLALAVSFKPTALPLIPAVFVFMLGRPTKNIFGYASLFLLTLLLLCIGPFFFFHWDPTPILTHWNAHFTVGGGLSFMTFLELWRDSYQLPGWWWLVGLLWLPALGTAAMMLKNYAKDLLSLLKTSTILMLVFFMFRTWLSEPNIVLVLPLILILVSAGDLDHRALTVLWVLPLLFAVFNTSLFQLLFPSAPGLMDRLLHLSDFLQTARLVLRILVVAPWLVACGWIVRACLRGRLTVGVVP
jgi:hypothetical protein